MRSFVCLYVCADQAAARRRWQSVFGVPFERAVKYHRWFGAIAMLAVTIHAATWYIKWLVEYSMGRISTSLTTARGAAGQWRELWGTTSGR
jgi:hypothetical protein